MSLWSHSPYDPSYSAAYYRPSSTTSAAAAAAAAVRTASPSLSTSQVALPAPKLTWQPPRPTTARLTSHTGSLHARPNTARTSLSSTLQDSITGNAVTPCATDTPTSVATTGDIHTELPALAADGQDAARTATDNNTNNGVAGNAVTEAAATIIETEQSSMNGYARNMYAAPIGPSCYDFYYPTYYQYYNYYNSNGGEAGVSREACTAMPAELPPTTNTPYYPAMSPYMWQPSAMTSGTPAAMACLAENNVLSEAYVWPSYPSYYYYYPAQYGSAMYMPEPSAYYPTLATSNVLPQPASWAGPSPADMYGGPVPLVPSTQNVPSTDHHVEQEEVSNNNNNNTSYETHGLLYSPRVLYSVAASLTPATLSRYATHHCLLCGRPGHCYVDCGLYDGTMLCLYAEQTQKVYVMRHTQWLLAACMGDVVRFVERALHSPCSTFDLWFDGVSFATMDRRVTSSTVVNRQQSHTMHANGGTRRNETEDATRAASVQCRSRGCAALSRLFLSRRCCYYQVLPGRTLFISRVQNVTNTLQYIAEGEETAAAEEKGVCMTWEHGVQEEGTRSVTASVSVSPSTAPAASPSSAMHEDHNAHTTQTIAEKQPKNNRKAQQRSEYPAEAVLEDGRSVSDITVASADLSQPPPSLDTTQQQQQQQPPAQVNRAGAPDRQSAHTSQNSRTTSTDQTWRTWSATRRTATQTHTNTTVHDVLLGHHCVETREASAAARRVCTLHIKFIPPSMTTGRLRQLLTVFGTLHRVRLLAPSDTHAIRRPFLLCFVEYASAREATTMMRYLHGCRVSRDFVLAVEQPRSAIANRHVSDYDEATQQPCIFGLPYEAQREVQRRYGLPHAMWSTASMTCAEAAARLDIMVDFALVRRKSTSTQNNNNNNITTTSTSITTTTIALPRPRSERNNNNTSRSNHVDVNSTEEMQGAAKALSACRSHSTNAPSRCSTPHSTSHHSSSTSGLVNATRMHEVSRRPEPQPRGRAVTCTYTKPPLSTVTNVLQSATHKTTIQQEQEQQAATEEDDGAASKIQEAQSISAQSDVRSCEDDTEKTEEKEKEDDALQVTRAMVREHTAHYALHADPAAFFSALRLLETALHAVRERAAATAAATFRSIITRTTSKQTGKTNHNSSSSSSIRSSSSSDDGCGRVCACDGISVSLLYLELLCDEVALLVCNNEAREACEVAMQVVRVIQSNTTTATTTIGTKTPVGNTAALQNEDIYTRTPLSEQRYKAELLEMALQESFMTAMHTDEAERTSPQATEARHYLRLEYVHCALHRLLYVILLLDTLLRREPSINVPHTDTDTYIHTTNTTNTNAIGGSFAKYDWAEAVLRTMLHVLRAALQLYHSTLAPLIQVHTKGEHHENDDANSDSESMMDTALSFVQVYCHNVQQVLVHDVQGVLEANNAASLQSTAASAAKEHAVSYKPGTLLAQLQPEVGSFALTILAGKTVTFFV